jgi:hypothetical protein
LRFGPGIQGELLFYAFDAYGNVVTADGVSVTLTYISHTGAFYGLDGAETVTAYYGIDDASDTLLVAEPAGWDSTRQAYAFDFLPTRAGDFSVEVANGTTASSPIICCTMNVLIV